MKFIVIGLGNFGASLAAKLTKLGHEVIGVDNRIEKVSLYKELMTHTICIDSTDPQAVVHLPIKDTDVVIVGIGEDEGASIMATAVMKQMQAKRIISRAVTPLQSTVLEAMGIHEIIHPEEESADRLAKKLNIKGIVDSFEVADNYNIVEARVPERFIGMTLEEAAILHHYNVVVLTTIKERDEKNLIGVTRKVTKVQGVATSSTVLNEGDIMLLYGDITDIKRLLRKED